MELKTLSYQMEEEQKNLVFCKNCKTSMFITERIWEKIPSGFQNLNYLQKWGTCCQVPDWIFITPWFDEEREIDPTIVESFLRYISKEYALKLLGMLL